MAKKTAERGTPGSVQNAKAPQDETPGSSRPAKPRKNKDIGTVKRKPMPGKKEDRNAKLLSDDTDIADETTI